MLSATHQEKKQMK